MKQSRLLLTSTMMLALLGANCLAQEGEAAARPRMPNWGERAQALMLDAIGTVATNDTVAKAIGLTDTQRETLREKLNDGEVPAILAAVRLAEALSAVLSDPTMAKALGLTEAQLASVKGKITPALIRQLLNPQELETLARNLAAGATGNMARFMQERGQPGGAQGGALTERMKEFDKDGDGVLNEEERRAAIEAFRQQRGQQRQGRQPQGAQDGGQQGQNNNQQPQQRWQRGDAQAGGQGGGQQGQNNPRQRGGQRGGQRQGGQRQGGGNGGGGQQAAPQQGGAQRGPFGG